EHAGLEPDGPSVRREVDAGAAVAQHEPSDHSGARVGSLLERTADRRRVVSRQTADAPRVGAEVAAVPPPRKVDADAEGLGPNLAARWCVATGRGASRLNACGRAKDRVGTGACERSEQSPPHTRT